MSAAPAAPASDLAEALARRTEALCAVSSVIGSERALCDQVEAWARARAPAVRRVKDSLVIRLDGPADAAAPAGAARRPLVALCGHLDTVPIHRADAGRPPRREDGRIVAPGSSDMKGGLAVMMELAERLPHAARSCDLVLVMYAREEGPYLENELGDVLRAADELAGVELALCLEPTDNLLQLGCVGSIHATFTFEGRAAHSARPWHGENAVHKAGALLAELHGRAPREAVSGGLVFREVASVTRIEGGRARNVVPDRCVLNVNFRFAPDKALDDAGAELHALGERFGALVELTDLSPACPAYADHPLVRRLLERTGITAGPKQAWTDVARLAAHGIPAANLGPGATSQAHQQGEWVEIAALERGYRILERFLSV
jgi:succinyl-diaminopimelate desuccinylase